MSKENEGRQVGKVELDNDERLDAVGKLIETAMERLRQDGEILCAPETRGELGPSPLILRRLLLAAPTETGLVVIGMGAGPALELPGCLPIGWFFPGASDQPIQRGDFGSGLRIEVLEYEQTENGVKMRPKRSIGLPRDGRLATELDSGALPAWSTDDLARLAAGIRDGRLAIKGEGDLSELPAGTDLREYDARVRAVVRLQEAAGARLEKARPRENAGAGDRIDRGRKVIKSIAGLASQEESERRFNLVEFPLYGEGSREGMRRIIITSYQKTGSSEQSLAIPEDLAVEDVLGTRDFPVAEIEKIARQVKGAVSPY